MSVNQASFRRNCNRRDFLAVAATFGGALALQPGKLLADLDQSVLPDGGNQLALSFSHFPSRVFAVIWRNWSLVPIDRIAKTLHASSDVITALGRSMGLKGPPRVSRDQQRRSAVTVIRRNWHLLPYEQLIELLGWTREQLAFSLREDDFLFIKLGGAKPKCDPIRYTDPSNEQIDRARQIGRLVRQEFPSPQAKGEDLFSFVEELSQPLLSPHLQPHQTLSPCFCYSYFGLYGDPLLDESCSPYPDGYLARLAAAGVSGVWLQGVLTKLSPCAWEPTLSAGHEARLAHLGRLIDRARALGLGVFLYLNEPRTLPLRFFQTRPELRGVVDGDYATLCTSHPDVQRWLSDSITFICRAAPDLAGFFTITASENLTNCWSHQKGANCPRCRTREPADVIAEVNALIQQGIRKSGCRSQLIAWDWGWPDAWAPAIIQRLPPDVALMSVSEWSMALNRGGIPTQVGEYSLSAIGPGPRAKRHWQLAKARGLKTIAKIQAGNTWELSAVPYIPVLENVARHVCNLLEAQVDGVMLGWTLGGYPSPNLEIVAETVRVETTHSGMATENRRQAIIAEAMLAVAKRRFGGALAPAVVRAWHELSEAFREFPFDGTVVYNAPMQYGPSNLLWAQPTGYHSSMVGFPYDDLGGWRGPYPVEVFIGQFEKLADGFEMAVAQLKRAASAPLRLATKAHRRSFLQELNVAEACAIHFRSTANQARFVQTRQFLRSVQNNPPARGAFDELERLIQHEAELARRLYGIQSRDARIGFEASNQYYYVPLDLVEKVINCRELLDRWIVHERP